jgi:hypothetical protein
MPLVEAGDKCCHQDGDARPSHSPQRISECGESFAPRPIRQNTQDAVADDVATFANIKVPLMKVGPVQAEEPVQQWIENPAGICGRKQRTRFNGNNDHPKDRGDPCFEKIVLAGAQICALLDGIIGSLAGDHDIVNVALSQTCAADAHEARFLQEFRDGGAAAIAHA